MTLRTTKRTVTFRRPFVLGESKEVLPAGSYSVETDEKLLEDISFPVYRRVSTLLYVIAKPSAPGVTRIVSIDPSDLDDALKRDQVPTEMLIGPEKRLGTSNRNTLSRVNKFDFEALERGENEGMTLQPV